MHHILTLSSPQFQRIDLVLVKFIQLLYTPISINNICIFCFIINICLRFYHQSIVIHHLLRLLQLHRLLHHSIEQVVCCGCMCVCVCIVYQLCIELIQETQVYLFISFVCPSHAFILPKFHSYRILISFSSFAFVLLFSLYPCFVCLPPLEYTFVVCVLIIGEARNHKTIQSFHPSFSFFCIFTRR